MAQSGSAATAAAGTVAPGEVERLFDRARFELKRGEVDEAISIFEEITLRAPDSAAAYRNLGVALHRRASHLDARDAFREAIALQPDLADAHHGLASALTGMGCIEESLECLARASELAPDNAAVQNDIGSVLVSLRRRDEAVAAFERAAELAPGWSVPWHNLAVIALRSGDRERAVALMRRSIAIGSPASTSHLELGMILLADGEFRDGWREYEWRWNNGGRPPRRPDLAVLPVWDGSPLGKRTLLLWHEQGYGDVLQFVRFASLIPKERGRVVLHAPPKLAALLATCPGIDQVVVDGDTLDVDVQYPLMSLANLFEITPAPIPGYLSAPAECRDAEEAIERGSAFNVGVVWASGKLYRGHANRDCPLELFAELGNIPGVRLYSLQYGDGAAELEASPLPIVDLSPLLGDFHRTSAFVKRLDLVITVDTSMPHLAGALGVPVWTLLAYSPDWRWRSEGDDCAWYGTMRLYRQPAPGDWAAVMQRVARDLRERTAGDFTAPPLPARAARPKPQAADARVFIKQYGERRTGTNYLRASLLANYADTEVLMHILGDKHAAPVPLHDLRREAEAQPDPAWAFITTATFGRPAVSTEPWNNDQLAEMRRLARGVTGAFDRGELRYTISIKDPHAWAVSLARADRWILGRMSLTPAFMDPLAKACRRFNRVYASWLALADAHPERICIVRYEDLVGNPAAVFDAMQKRFGLERRAPQWQEFGDVLQSAHWDGWNVARSEATFDRRYYIERRYLERIPPEHGKIIAETIQWPLFARFGYEPLR